MQTGGADDRAARLSIRYLVPPIRPAAAPNFPAVTREKTRTRRERDITRDRSSGVDTWCAAGLVLAQGVNARQALFSATAWSARWLESPGTTTTSFASPRCLASASSAFSSSAHMFVPSDFGVYGFFRAGALDDVRAAQVRYAGEGACVDCHSAVTDERRPSKHAQVRCEACHGPLFKHAAGEMDTSAHKPDSRKLCPTLSSKTAGRPDGSRRSIVADHAGDAAVHGLPQAAQPEDSVTETAAMDTEPPRVSRRGRQVHRADRRRLARLGSRRGGRAGARPELRRSPITGGA